MKKSLNTIPLPANTRNGSYNVPEQVMQTFNRLCFQGNFSKCDIIRQGIPMALEAQGFTEEANEMRDMMRDLMKAACVFAGLLAVLLTSMGAMDSERRNARLRPSMPRVYKTRAVTGRNNTRLFPAEIPVEA